MSEERSIGRYRVLSVLGEGAMGTVYLAEDPHIERKVAIKVLRMDEVGLEEDRRRELQARFLREAKIVGRLAHPNIVAVYDVGTDGGLPWIAMEFVDGTTLSERMRSGDPTFSLPERLRVVRDMALALAHAHGKEVVHRDIKPGNVMLTRGGAVKVADFGIGKLIGGSTEVTRTGMMVGTPSYMSPEQVRGEKVDSKSDTFSVGVVLYELVTGKRPFPADTITTLVYQILNVEPPDPVVERSDLPPGLGAILQKCLAKDPKERYESIHDLAAELDVVLGSLGVPLGDRSPTRILPTAEVLAAAASVAAPAAAGVGPDDPTSLMPSAPKQARPAASPPPLTPVAPSAKRSPIPYVAGGVVVVLLAFAAYRMAGPGGETTPPGENVPQPPATAPTEPPPLAPVEPSTAEPPIEPAPVGSDVPSTSPVEPAAAPDTTPVPTPAPEAGPAPTTRPTAGPTSPTPPVATTPTLSAPPPNREPLPGAPTFTSRGAFKIEISPDDARLTLDDRPIGTSDDWDGMGGGALLEPGPGWHVLRASLSGFASTAVQLRVDSSASQERADVDVELVEHGDGKYESLDSPEGATRGPVSLAVEPDETIVLVDGKRVGVAADFRHKPLMLGGAPRVATIELVAPDGETKRFRVVVAASGKSVVEIDQSF